MSAFYNQLMEAHMSSRFPARLNVDEFATVNRRGLLRALGAAALLTSTGGFFARSLWGSPVFATYPFPLGVASGDRRLCDLDQDRAEAVGAGRRHAEEG